MARLRIRPGDTLDRGDPGLFVIIGIKNGMVLGVWKRRRRRGVPFEVDADCWCNWLAAAERRKAGPPPEWDLGGEG